MRNSSSDMAIYYTAKPSITLPFLAHSFVVARGVRPQYYPYSSLHSSAAPCSTPKRSAIKSLVASRLRQAILYVVNCCEQVVGKLVKSLRVTSGFILRFHSLAGPAALPVVVVNKLSDPFKQFLAEFTQDKSAKLLRLSSSFYTLPTGPTNTTNLNKGIGL